MPHVKQMTKNLPEMMPLPRVPEVFGVSRSGLYRLAAEGKIRMVKLGARTLVDISTLRDFLANLPTLVVKAGARSSNSP